MAFQLSMLPTDMHLHVRNTIRIALVVIGLTLLTFIFVINSSQLGEIYFDIVYAGPILLVNYLQYLPLLYIGVVMVKQDTNEFMERLTPVGILMVVFSLYQFGIDLVATYLLSQSFELYARYIWFYSVALEIRFVLMIIVVFLIYRLPKDHEDELKGRRLMVIGLIVFFTEFYLPNLTGVLEDTTDHLYFGIFFILESIFTVLGGVITAYGAFLPTSTIIINETESVTYPESIER